MVNTDQIKAGMPVVCSNDGQFAVVDHMEGQSWVKLKKGDGTTHHWMPLSWVTSTASGKVKVDRPGTQAMKEWSTTAPKQ